MVSIQRTISLNHGGDGRSHNRHGTWIFELQVRVCQRKNGGKYIEKSYKVGTLQWNRHSLHCKMLWTESHRLDLNNYYYVAIIWGSYFLFGGPFFWNSISLKITYFWVCFFSFVLKNCAAMLYLILFPSYPPLCTVIVAAKKKSVQWRHKRINIMDLKDSR